MTDKNDKPKSFGIEETKQVGDRQLLNDLLSPETSTSDVEDLEDIKSEEEAKPEQEPDNEQDKNNLDKPEEEKPKKKDNVLGDFLNSEEEKEKEEEEPQPETEEPLEEEPVEENKFSALSKDLFKLGVFSSEGDEEEEIISTAEEFLEKFNSEKKKGAMGIVDNFIGQFGEDYRKAFDAIFVKGVDPRKYFSTYNNIVKYSELDLTKEGNQEAVVRKVLSDQGFEPDDIDTEVERLKNYGDLESVSAKYHKVLTKKEATSLEEMEKKAEEQQRQRELVRSQYINNIQSILREKLDKKEFDGIPINSSLAAELQDFLLVDKYRTVSGETLTDFDRSILELKRPENHHKKVKVALILKLLEKDPTLSTIQKSGVTKHSNKLFEEVARHVKSSSNKGIAKKTVTSKRDSANSFF